MRFSLDIPSEIQRSLLPGAPFQRARGSAGFSLVELMVVVSIMGILSTIAIPNYLRSARRQMAITQMRSLASGIRAIRAREDLTSGEITGHWCSACECWGREKSASCQNRMDTSLKKLNFRGAIKDPWGGYYMLDENEGEFSYAVNRNDVLMAYNADDSTYLVVPISNHWGTAPFCDGSFFCFSQNF